jgi:hypothetical protein
MNTRLLFLLTTLRAHRKFASARDRRHAELAAASCRCTTAGERSYIRRR